MCQIFYRPSRSRGIVSLDWLEHSRDNGNDDAYGIMVAANGTLDTWRGLSADFAELQDRVAHHNAGPFPFAVHMRLATHGDKGLSNAHPFTPRSDVGMMHNGILSAPWNPGNKDIRSDTALLAETLRNMPRRWWANPAIRDILASAIGLGNRLTILHASGAGMIVNEDTGTWESGIWLANDSYKPYRPRGKWVTHYNGQGWTDLDAEDDNATRPLDRVYANEDTLQDWCIRAVKLADNEHRPIGYYIPDWDSEKVPGGSYSLLCLVCHGDHVDALDSVPCGNGPDYPMTVNECANEVSRTGAPVECDLCGVDLLKCIPGAVNLYAAMLCEIAVADKDGGPRA